MTDARVPPHSVEAERAVLGAVLLHPKSFAEVQGVVDAADFYVPANQAVFAAMASLDADGQPIDALTVARRMREQSTFDKLRAEQGEAYFVVLTDAVVTVENVRFHAEMISGRATVRRLIEAAAKVAVEGYGNYGDFDAYLERSQKALADAFDSAPTTDPLDFRAVQRESLARLEARFDRQGQLTGVPSGMRDFDRSNGGWQETELGIVAARPGVGKTAWALWAAEVAARSGVPVLFFSLEMDRRALYDRHLASVARVHATQMRTASLGRPEWERIVRASSSSAGLPLWIDDETGQTIATIRGKARRWRTRTAPADKYPQALIFVDYLQLIAGSRTNNMSRAEEVGTFSAGLKNLARELRLPVIALAQLNRQVESRSDKRPALADLRESGSIEQDADLVAFLHRPALYDLKADREHAELIVAKNRSGPCGAIRLRWQEEYTRYSDEAEWDRA